jgi:putative Mn2+ efflux pump MntP
VIRSYCWAISFLVGWFAPMAFEQNVTRASVGVAVALVTGVGMYWLSRRKSGAAGVKSP